MRKTKTCNVCGEKKPSTLFQHRDDGKRDMCKSCRNKWARDYRKTEAGKKSTLKARLRQRYNMTIEQYDVMWDAQDGRCAVCGCVEVVQTESGAVRRLCVDHDHKTGKIRSLLCQACNKALGVVDDDVAWLLNLVRYLQCQQDS